MLLAQARLQWPQVHGLHNNVYDAPEMGARFGLHGIAAFFLCSGAKKNR